jgi:hypothetical protein
MTIPMHESTTPETLGRGGVRAGVLGVGVAPVLFVLPEEDTETPSASACDPLVQPTLSHSLAFGITDVLDLEAGVFYGSFSNGWRAGLKYQWLGRTRWFSADRNTWSSSIALRYLRLYTSGQSWNPTLSEASTNPMHGHGTCLQIAMPIGYRVASWLSLDLAPKYVGGSLAATYRDYPCDGRTTRTRRRYAGYGGSAGLTLHPHGERSGFEFRLEAYAMNLPLENTCARTWCPGGNISLALPFRIGGR